MHMVVWPVAPDEGILSRAAPRLDPAAGQPQRALDNLLARAASADFLRPGLQGSPQYGAEQQYVFEVQIDADGTGHLLAGRAAAELRGQLVVMEDSVATHAARFLYAMALLYEEAGYYGAVEAAVAVTGIRGALSAHLAQRFQSTRALSQPYARDDFRRGARFPQQVLVSEPVACAKELVQPLLDATTQGRIDVFGELSGAP